MTHKSEKIRLDHLLVDLGFSTNPTKARARIMAGDVIVNDHRVDKPSEKFSIDARVRMRSNSHPYVSRGGLKLEHALSVWPMLLKDQVALDVGASTGGFTEVLLNHGVKQVYAVDVGYGQLAEKLRTDARVVNLERTHILQLQKSTFIDLPTICVIDLSFISLTKVLPHIKEIVAKDASIYALVKPQFEAGREQVGKGGIVKDPLVHQEVLKTIKQFAESIGLHVVGTEKSPILGAKGNTEFLMAMKKLT